MNADAPIRLSSLQMANFVTDGYLRLDGVVPAALCAALLAEFEAGFTPTAFGAALGSPESEWPGRPVDRVWGPETNFGQVLALPRIQGLIQSLVGPSPLYDHHFVHVLEPRHLRTQAWHADAVMDTRWAFDIQLFFFFQETPREMGGTLLLPGSHLRRVHEGEIGRSHNIVGQTPMVCPAGSLLACHHGIWHCGQANLSDRPRYMLKLRLNPRVVQQRLFDLSDAASPEVYAALHKGHPWQGTDGRLDLIQRTLFWRYVSASEDYDVEYYLTRLENQAHAGPAARTRRR
jgi:Phytanoyl-CoA dioxygenase (PhyH)